MLKSTNINTVFLFFFLFFFLHIFVLKRFQTPMSMYGLKTEIYRYMKNKMCFC